MCQPVGRVLGLPHGHSFALRSSPIICVVDSFAMLLQFVSRGIQTRSAFEGVNLTVQARFADVQADEDGSFAALRKNTVFRILLFFMGALPQAIKIYAVRGVPWTQALATVYLASFLLSEIAAVIARLDRAQQVPSTQNTSRYAKFWVLSTMGVLVVSTALAYIVFTAAIFVIVRNGCTYPAWPLNLFPSLINISTSISFYTLTQNISLRYTRYIHFQLSGYFFLLHLITALLGFGFLYNPTSTVKPAWTDALG